MSRAVLLTIAIFGAALVASCEPDPAHDNLVASLGPEDPSVPTGPQHRPGQPCLACHGGSGPANTQLSIGGTAYQSQAESVPLVGATVQIFDANNTEKDLTTNAAGNFFIKASEWAPAYPMHGLTLSFANTPATMTTTVGRDGSCATCHYEPTNTDAGAGPRTPGHLYLVLDPADFPTTDGTNGGGP